MLVVSALHIYPVKGTAARRLSWARVEARGLAGDRRWMLVDGQGRFLTQREHPRLARVHVRPEGAALHVEAPRQAPLVVPVPGAEAPRRPVQVWKDAVVAVDGGDGAARWFSSYLGQDCRLVFQPEDGRRPVDPDYAVGAAHVSFADGFPLLLTTEASLADLNARLDAPVPMDRFRPNLVVGGGEAFDEDDWQTLRVGAVPFHVVKPCARCVVTTVDQVTGEGGKEPLRTLATFRARDGKVLFGQNLIPAGAGVIRVGDPVAVEARRAGGQR